MTIVKAGLDTLLARLADRSIAELAQEMEEVAGLNSGESFFLRPASSHKERSSLKMMTTTRKGRRGAQMTVMGPRMMRLLNRYNFTFATLQVPTRESIMRQAALMVNAKQGMKKGRRRN